MSSEGIQSEGRTLFCRWMLGPPSRSQGAVAKLLGVTQPAVRAWMKGISRPEPHLREAIEVLAGVPKATWELESERVAKEAAIERIHDAEEQAADASDSEPTNPAVPVAKRQSSAPPPLDGDDAFGSDAENTAVDQEPIDSVVTPVDLPPVKVSERNVRTDTNPDDRGDVLPVTPKPLTVLDREEESAPRRGRVSTPGGL